MNNTINIKDLQPSYVFQTDTEEHKEDILNQAKEDNKEACWVGYGTGDINSQYQPSPIKDDDYYMKYCNSDNYDYLKDYRLVWGYSIGIVEEDVIINTDTGEHLAEGEDCATYTPPSDINYKKGKWLRFNGVNNLNPDIIQEVYLPDYIISFKDLCSSLQSINIIENLDTSHIYNMSNAFHNKNDIRFYINNTDKLILDFINVKDASHCFDMCTIHNESIDFINCNDDCNYDYMFYFSYLEYLPTGVNKQNIGGNYMFQNTNLQGDINITMKLYSSMFANINYFGSSYQSLNISGHLICSDTINHALYNLYCNSFTATIDFSNAKYANNVFQIAGLNKLTIDLTTLNEDCNYNELILSERCLLTIIPPTFKLKYFLFKNIGDSNIIIDGVLKYYTIYDEEFTKNCALSYANNYYNTRSLNIVGTIEISTLFVSSYSGERIQPYNITGNLKLIDNCPDDINVDYFTELMNKYYNLEQAKVLNDQSINLDDYSTLDLILFDNVTKEYNKEDKKLIFIKEGDYTNDFIINVNKNTIIYINYSNYDYVDDSRFVIKYNIINNTNEINIIYLVQNKLHAGSSVYAINAPNSDIILYANIDSYKIYINKTNNLIINSKKSLNVSNITIIDTVNSITYDSSIRIDTKKNQRFILKSSSIYNENNIDYNIFNLFYVCVINDDSNIIDYCPFPELIHENGNDYILASNNYYKNFDVSLLNKYYQIYNDYSGKRRAKGIRDYINRIGNNIEKSNILPITEDIDINFSNVIPFNNYYSTLMCNGDYRKVHLKSFGNNLYSHVYAEWTKTKENEDDEDEQYLAYAPENIEGGIVYIHPGLSTYLNLKTTISSRYTTDYNTIGFNNEQFNYTTIIYSSDVYCGFKINIPNVQSLIHLNLDNAKLYNLDIRYCDCLDDESINSILSADYYSGANITISYVIYDKLTDEQKQIVIDKGCTLISYVYER